VFLHGFEQRALRFWRRAIDFVSKHKLREYRSGLELELAGFLAKDRNADNVGW
jgi:hypothetical protein